MSLEKSSNKKGSDKRRSIDDNCSETRTEGGRKGVGRGSEGSRKGIGRVSEGNRKGIARKGFGRKGIGREVVEEKCD